MVEQSRRIGLGLECRIYRRARGVTSVPVLLAAGVLCFALSGRSVQGAVLSTAAVTAQSSGRLTVGTMAENARINSNRDDVFVEVPEFLQGLKYISHLHGQAGAVVCAVKTGGRLYLCVDGPKTFGRMKVGGQWKTAGWIDSSHDGGKKTWTVYQTDAKAGQKLTFPSDGTWGAVVVAGKIDRKAAPSQTLLTEAGLKLLERYTGMLTELRAQVVRSVPLAREREQALALLEAEIERQKPKQPDRDSDFAPRKSGVTDAALAELLGELKTESKAKLKAELKAEREKPAPVIDKKVRPVFQFLRAHAAGAGPGPDRSKSKAFVETLSKRMDAAGPLLAEVAPFLSSDTLDARLARYVVLSEGTPRGLAEFAQQGKAREQLVERLLADADLMLQMVVADGAKAGRYGQAMKIYTDIQEASTKARGSVLQRLALAVSLEHAVPIAQQNPKARTDAPATVTPVHRYLHYEKAFLAGELDPGFKDLTVWDYRMVVNGHEPDWTLTWGRQMLRNYRPDHISTADYRWRYVAAVRTDIRYGSQDNKHDKPELQFFQNILMNGGVCGRRAFFGRFILRSFGVPTTARPQRGHAALAHWTPDGWVVCLGGGWGSGWVMGRNKDLDFLAITQARAVGEPYMRVKRAQWIGDVLGEGRTFGLFSGDPAFWNAVALYTQRQIIKDAKAKTLAAVGEDIGEANESKVTEEVKAATVTEEDRKVIVGTDGVITIPAVACSKPTNSTAKIKFMKSHLGGMQLHYNRLGKPEEFEYTFEAPATGKYALTARVVTPSWKQHLLVAANGATKPIDIALPFTVGKWDTTQPVEVSLVKGRNVLRFSRNEPVKGLTIKDFTLRPAK